MVDISPAEELDAEFEPGGRSWPVLTAFTDVGFRKTTAHQLVPVLYVLAIAGALVSYLFGAVLAFESSALLGLFWLVIAGPVACVAIVLVARLMLESLLAVLAMGRRGVPTYRSSSPTSPVLPARCTAIRELRSSPSPAARSARPRARIPPTRDGWSRWRREPPRTPS